MKNIRIIKKDIDVSGILNQLEQYPDDWGNVSRMKGVDRQDPHTKLVTSGVLQLVMGGISKPGEFIGDTEICVPTDATTRHIEIQKWLSTLNLKVGRCAFLKTEPGGMTGKHIDEGNYYLTKDRYHLAIKGIYRYTVWDNPDDDSTKEVVVVAPGTFFWFDNKKNHMAENIGPAERIAFIFDVPMAANNP
jgi:hypothetical protein